MNSSASAASRTRWRWLMKLLILKGCIANLISFGLSSTSRISTQFSLRRSASIFEREVESSPLFRLGVGPSSPAVPVHDTLDDGQPDSRARIFIRSMQSLEDSKQLVRVAHVESHAVVLDEVMLLSGP